MDSYGGLGLSVTILIWKINFGWDAFKSIREHSQQCQ